MVYKLIVSVMLFVLTWTGTFLHDLAEDWCDGQHCDTAIISHPAASNVSDISGVSDVSGVSDDSNSSNFSSPSDQKKTLEDIDCDGHIHMAVLAGQNHDELLKIANERAVQFDYWINNSPISEAARERPPPHASKQHTSQKIFLATRRLLI